MRIYSKIGSKERLFEMMSKVNKTKPNYEEGSEVDELRGVVKEIQDYVPDEEDPMALPPDYSPEDLPKAGGDDGGVSNDPYDQEPEYEEGEASEEDQQAYVQAYNELTAAGVDFPTPDQIEKQVMKIKGLDKPVEKTRAIPKGAEEFYESTDQDRYEDVVFLQGEEANEPLEILRNQGEDAALKYLQQWHEPGNHEGKNELGHGSNDQTYEKDGYVMVWNFPLNYIGLSYELSNLNEVGDDIDVNQDDNLIKNSFNALINNKLEIRNTETITENDETFLEVNAVQDNNTYSFKFKVVGGQNNQDDVFSVEEAKLIKFDVNFPSQNKRVEVEEGVSVLDDFNAQEQNSIINFVSEYVSFNDAGVNDDIFEEAIKLIDKIPYKKGSETIQTQKAYADQKPVNPKLRVDNPELQKFVKEDDYPDPIGKAFAASANKYPKPKKKINKKVKIKEGSELYGGKLDQVKSEISQIKSLMDTGRTPKMWVDDDGFLHVSAEDGEYFADYYNEFGGGYPTVDSRLEDIAEKYGFYWDWEDPASIILVDDSLAEQEEASQEDDGVELDMGVDDIETLAQDKEEAGEMIAGGLAQGKDVKEFNPEQIKLGLEVELEHSEDPMIAIEIAMDHLAEDPEYYTRKDDPEASAQFGAANDVDGEEADELLGYKPMNVGQTPEEPEEDSEEKDMEDELLGYKPMNVGDYEGEEEDDLDEVDVVKDDDVPNMVDKGDKFTVTDSDEDEINLQKD